MDVFKFNSALYSLALYSLPEKREHYRLTGLLTLEGKVTLFTFFSQLFAGEVEYDINEVAKRYIDAINGLAGHLQMKNMQILERAKIGLQALYKECDQEIVREELETVIATLVTVQGILT